MNKQYCAKYKIISGNEVSEPEDMIFFSDLFDLKEQIEDFYIVDDIDYSKNNNQMIFSWDIDENGVQVDEDLNVEKHKVTVIISTVYKLTEINLSNYFNF